MAKVSMIIPSRCCKYASRTVEDIYENFTGDFECLICLDDYWPVPMIKDHPNLTIVHKGAVKGMRNSINLAVHLARGKWIMKADDHTMFSKGFDEEIFHGIQEDWLVQPPRYTMDPEKWEMGRGPTEYLFVTYPYKKDNMYGNGLHGKKWIGEDGIGINMGKDQFYWRENHRKDIVIDDIQTFQGSFWGMSKEKYLAIGGLDELHSDLMENEPQELGFKIWGTGGRCVINRFGNLKFAHMHKNERELDNRGRTWKLSWEAMRQTGRFQTFVWMNDKWPKATRNMEWFVNHFWPMPGWPDNWKEERAKYNREKPEMNKDFRIFDQEGPDGFGITDYETVYL